MTTNDTNDANNEPSQLLNPIVLVTLIILGAVVALISMATLGWDKGVLSSMARQDYARGVITYLFAVVTIGTAVVIILAALLAKDNAHSEKQFQRGKEILSLMLGVFGTIVGFYFGSSTGIATHEFRLSPIHFAAPTEAVSGRLRFEAVASGGTPPYLYGIDVGKDPDKLDRPVRNDGWILEDLNATQNAAAIHIIVQDAAGNRVEQSGLVGSQS